MKLYTNENNGAALKLLIAAQLAKEEVTVEIVSLDDKRFQCPKRLPVLELASGVRLFSSNAGTRFLYPPPTKVLAKVEKWLSWEASELLPTLLHLGLKGEPSNAIEKLIAELEAALSSNSFLCGSSLSAADVSVWACLHPVYTEAKLKQSYLSKSPKVLQWMATLSDDPSFKAALTKLSGAKGSAALNSVGAAHWLPSQLVGSKPQDHSESASSSEVSEDEKMAAVEAWLSSESEPRKKLTSPVLPKPGEKNILITSALPYVNNVPHLGNIIGCVLSADVFARYCRGKNRNTLYVSGTDEYGTATETKALEEKITPREICDKYFAIHDEIYKWFGIGFDHFGRTTRKEQTEVVQEMFLACYKNSYTLENCVEQLVCEQCDRYLADRFVEGICPDCKFEDARGDQCDGCGHLINAIDLIQPKCKLCKATPVIKQSSQLFLDLPKIESRLSEWFEKSSVGWSHNARVITQAWLKEGLKPRCITRNLKWGIPVPLEQFSDKVFYVWFDAPIGYMSMTKAYTPDWQKWWRPSSEAKVKLYQFMAKDNVPFHSIMFPATLMASGGNYTLLNHLMATEYLNYEDGKFSKSRGVGVFGNDAKETGIPSDLFRFYLLFIRPESQDSSFSWVDMATKCNSELLNNLGNFINRALMFIEKFFKSSIPEVVLGDEEKILLALINKELKSYEEDLDRARLKEGIKYILNISRHGNYYIQSTKPWELVKSSDESDKQKAQTIVGFSTNMVCLLAVLLQPYMPQTVETIGKQLNLNFDNFAIPTKFKPFLKAGHKIGKPSPLFSKIEPAMVDAFKARYAGKQKSPGPDQVVVKVDGDVKKLEEAVASQAEVVRSMKSSGKSKEEWQPQVKVLLELKKQLEEAKKIAANPPNNVTVKSEPVGDKVQTEKSAEELEKLVQTQADHVRSLKSSGKPKSEWQPQVQILLDLKKQLENAKKSAPSSNSAPPPVSSPKQPSQKPIKVEPASPKQPVVKEEPCTPPKEASKVQELEMEIQTQGEKVRSLKSSGADKSVWQPEVDRLIALKKELSSLTGVPFEPPSSGKKKKWRPFFP